MQRLAQYRTRAGSVIFGDWPDSDGIKRVSEYFEVNIVPLPDEPVESLMEKLARMEQDVMDRSSNEIRSIQQQRDELLASMPS